MRLSAGGRHGWGLALALFAVSSLPAAAQLQLGETSTSLSGTVSAGYSADYGNQISSDHSWLIGGTANFGGSFYNPNFLTYSGNVYLNQSRVNSNFQSISNASGFNLSTNLFNGTRFPGSISYSQAWDAEGNYAIPGVANYVTKGNNSTFGINWSENLTNVPTLAASFQMGNSHYSVYGTNDDGTNNFHSLNLHSSYRIDDFSMGAYYTWGGAHSLIPQAVSGEANTTTDNSNDGVGFSVSHPLPLHGTVSANWNRNSWDTNYLSNQTNGTIDIVNAVASIHPTRKLSFSLSTDYSDNLAGQIIQSELGGTDIGTVDTNSESSNSFDVIGTGSYLPMNNLQLTAIGERRQQSYLGETYGLTSFGGSGTYSHALLGGSFNASLVLIGNTSDQTGDNTLSFSTYENFSDELLGWQTSFSFGYSQNVETLLVTYMNSNYSFSGNARRRWGSLSVAGGASISKTGLTDEPDTDNTNQSYSGTVGYSPWITANGNYTKATGQALLTGSGLVPTPTPVPTPGLLALYGGQSYSAGLSSSPIRKLMLTASYSRSSTNTTNQGVSSSNQNKQFNSLIQYQYRKLGFTSGYSRLEQGFSVSGSEPEVVSSFYMGVSRWFNFF